MSVLAIWIGMVWLKELLH
jgi:hypothetical protein